MSERPTTAGNSAPAEAIEPIRAAHSEREAQHVESPAPG